jgi:hypothetical protein
MPDMRVIHNISAQAPDGDVTCEAGVHSEEFLRRILGDEQYQRLVEDGTIVPADGEPKAEV